MPDFELVKLLNNLISISIQGGLNYLGLWDSGTSYVIGDVIYINGSGYVAKADNLNKDPETETAFWQLLAHKGDTGATGADGADGADGAQGEQGIPGEPGADGIDGVDGTDGIDGTNIVLGTNTADALTLVAGVLSLEDKFVQIAGDEMTDRLTLPTLQFGKTPIPTSTTIVSVVAGVSAVISNAAIASTTASYLNVRNVNRNRLVQVNTTLGSTTVTGNFLDADVGASIYSTQPIMNTTLGVNTTRISFEGQNTSSGISSMEIQLLPDANIDPANRITSQILLYNVTGSNYERYLISNFDHTASIITSAQGMGLQMPIVLQVGGNVGHNTGGVNAIKVYGDASTEIQSATYITGISVLDSSVFTKITGIRSVVAGVSAYLSTSALSTGTVNVWVQPGHGAGRVVTGVGTTLGSRTITGDFLATDILDFINQVEVNAGGTGYTVGDLLTIVQGGNNAKAVVTSVSSGVVTGVKVDTNNVGSGYTGGIGLSTTGGTGTGCTLDVGCSGAGVWSLPSVASVFTDSRTVTDGVITNASKTITSASASFISGDVGRSVRGDGILDGTFIESVTNSTTAVLSQASSRTASGVSLTFGQSWVLDTAIGTSTGFSSGARSKINVTIVGSSGTALKSNVYVTSGKTVIIPAIGASGDQLPVIGDVALVAYGQKTFANGVLRLVDPFNTGSTQFVLDTVTGAGGVSANTNKVRMYFKRGGATKWVVGLNASFLNSDTYDIVSSEGTPRSVLDTSGLRNSGYIRAGSTSAPNNTTAGDVTGVRLSLGNVAMGATGQLINGIITDTTTASGSNSIVGITATYTPASDSAAEQRGFNYQNILNPATGIAFTATNGIQAGYFENRLRGDGLVTKLIGVTSKAITGDSSSASAIQATTGVGYDAQVWTRPSGTPALTLGTGIGFDTANLASASGLTVTTLTGFRMANPAANTITTLLGVDIAALTRGATNIGLRIAAPSGGATANYALQLSDTGGAANGGITFGTDTTLYRSAADTLKTDDSLIVTGTFTAGTYTGQSSIVTLGTIVTGVWNGTVVDVAHGGSGAATLTGILKGNGTSAFTAVTAPSGAIVGDTDTITLTNKTLTSPKIDTILDANGNELIKFTTTTTAVNELTIANAAATGSVIVSTTGDDTNISMQFAPKGTGKFIVRPGSLSTTAFQILNTSAAGVFLVDTTNVRIGIGTGSPVNTISIVGTAAKTIGMERHSTADTAGNTLTVLSGGATSGATNKAAGNLILQTGLSTGSGSGQILFQTTANTAGSTSDNAVATRLTIDLNGLTIAEGMNIVLGTTTGTKIGTAGGASGQKLGFFNSTPIVQPLLATGVGSTVDNVITALQNLGLVRQS
jgi:hypothetical protein